jgi:outer membrane murein-binding lipoprotein Lpp
MANAAYYGAKPALDSAEQAAHVATAAALTSTAASGGDAPTEAEYNALRTDVSNLRATVAALQTAFRNASLQASS